MPCYTVRQTPVTFEKVAYKPGHMGLLIEALKQLGYEIEATGTAIKIWSAAARATVENTILYKDGRFQVPSTLQGRFSLERVKEAYAREAVKLHARRNGWLLNQISETEFELTKRG